MQSDTRSSRTSQRASPTLSSANSPNFDARKRLWVVATAHDQRVALVSDQQKPWRPLLVRRHRRRCIIAQPKGPSNGRDDQMKKRQRTQSTLRGRAAAELVTYSSRPPTLSIARCTPDCVASRIAPKEAPREPPNRFILSLAATMRACNSASACRSPARMIASCTSMAANELVAEV